MQGVGATARWSERRWRGMLRNGVVVLLLGYPTYGPCAEKSDVLSVVAGEITALRAEIAATEQESVRVKHDLARLRAETDTVTEGMKRIERRAQVPPLGRGFVQAVSEQRHMLPVVDRIAAVHERHERELEDASDAKFRVERALAGLGDVASVAARQVAAAEPPIDAAQQAQVAASLATQLGEQVKLLTRLDEVRSDLLTTLRQIAASELDLIHRSQAAHDALTRLQFWVPGRAGMEDINEVAPSVAWTLSAENWRLASTALRLGVVQQPAWPALALVIALALVVSRRRLCDLLASWSPARMGRAHYGLGVTVAAIAITFLLALPGPILLATASSILGRAPESSLFALALGDALAVVAKLLFAMSAFAWLLDRRGVGSTHFGWDEASNGRVARALRRFAALFIPLIFVATLNGLDHAPFANRESLGRLAFLIAMLALTAFFARLLHSASPVMQSIRMRHPRSKVVRWHDLWFTLLLALPLGIAGLATGGYFIAAGYFFGRMVYTLFLTLGAMTLYGLIALWIQMRRNSFLRLQNDQAVPLGAAREDFPSMVAPKRDVAELGAQARSLLDLLITLLLLGGLWEVWKDALPIISVLGDYVLWTYERAVDGKTVALPITVGRLFLTLVIAVVMTVAVRNVGPLLDMLLLQRLETKADANYAIKVMTRYGLVAAAILISCRILGIGWGDLHLLIAALGVGLGFGLQEIVANFVSGLIVLAERPIRIGDVVTVGEVTGTVTKIRARDDSARFRPSGGSQPEQSVHHRACCQLDVVQSDDTAVPQGPVSYTHLTLPTKA